MNELHHHSILKIEKLNKAFLWGIALNLLFVIVEVIFGLLSSSLALLSDAGHNLGDVFSLLLSLLAFKLMVSKPNSQFTYGYRKSSVLIALINACVLLITVGIILVESIQKLMSPTETNGSIIAIIAGVGVFINGFSAWLFFKDRKNDLNIKGAYLHLLSDAFVSIGVVISGVLIHFTHLYIIDPIIGICVAIIILFSTIDLLKQSFRLSLDGVPQNIDIKKIKKGLISQFHYIEDIHHLHIWALSTTQIAMTAHCVVNTFTDHPKHKNDIKQYLNEQGIDHVTLEFEGEEEDCPDKDLLSF